MGTMMLCGHAANSIDGNGDPSCAICACLGLAGNRPIVTPSLEGRKAKCFEGCLRRDSNTELAFFEYLGPDSPAAINRCKHCGFYEEAHTKEKPPMECRSHKFEPHGAYEFDSYYCGCRGWD